MRPVVDQRRAADADRREAWNKRIDPKTLDVERVNLRRPRVCLICNDPAVARASAWRRRRPGVKTLGCRFSRSWCVLVFRGRDFRRY